MVLVFREVRRVLRHDGTLWLNIGDSFANDSKWGGPTSGKYTKELHGNTSVGRTKNTGLKAKDLMMIPARVAMALQADGWYLRSDIIWDKSGNVMPESVKDRPTRAHEYVFLLTKNQDYFYDADSVREPSVGQDSPSGRNRRDVFRINTTPYRGAHFATMPYELATLCVKAGSQSGDIVLDPFAGSGTTLASAKTLGRAYLGIEINEEYRPLIEERLAKATNDQALRSAFEDAMELE